VCGTRNGCWTEIPLVEAIGLSAKISQAKLSGQNLRQKRYKRASKAAESSSSSASPFTVTIFPSFGYASPWLTARRIVVMVNDRNGSSDYTGSRQAANHPAATPPPLMYNA
jgi:hypothetical protein